MGKHTINSDISLKIGDNKDIVLLVASLILSLAFLNFYVKSIYEGAASMEKEIVTSRGELIEKEALLKNLENFNEENANTVSVNAEKLNGFISNRNNYEDFWAHISNLAFKDSLSLSTIQVDSSSSSSSSPSSEASSAVMMGDEATMSAASLTSSSSSLNEGRINFSVSGELSDFLHFLKSLENSTPFVQIDSLSINYEGSDSSEGSEVVGVQEIDLYPTLTYNVAFKFVYY